MDAIKTSNRWRFPWDWDNLVIKQYKTLTDQSTNMNINPKLNLIFLITLFLLACDGCKSGNSDPFTRFNPYDAGLTKRLESYNDLKYPRNTKTGNTALYIDFSSGINNAFRDPVISGLMTQCFNTILTDKFDVYKLGSNQVAPLTINNTTELGQKVSDPREYTDVYAPIQAAVEKITNADNDALLITDFEEWQNKAEVTNAAYLKIPFSRWLSKGNSIHFFIADYKDGTVDKHIYFTIFSCGNPSSSSLITKLASKLSLLNNRFDLSANAYKLSTDYPGEKMGGIFYEKNAKNVLDLKPNYVYGNAYEFYPLGLDWKTIIETHDAYKDQQQFNDMFRHLFIDLSNEDSYSYGDFTVKTADISDDFVKYAEFLEVLNHKPKLNKGTNGEAQFADDEKDEIALKCYNTDGSIKDKCKYEQQAPIPIPDFFLLNEQLYKNTKSSDPAKTELGVSFDPKLKLKNLPCQDGLVKVDIVLNSAKPNTDNPKLEKFKWSNAKGVPNIALYESIKNTLQEVKPGNKVIYSYYIKTNQ